MDQPAIAVYELMLNNPNSTPDEKRCASEMLKMLYSHAS